LGRRSRAGLLAQLGNVDAAEEAYQMAIGLEADPAVRHFLQQRRGGLRREATQSMAQLSAHDINNELPRRRARL